MALEPEDVHPWALGEVGHLLEEARQPIAAEVWYRIEEEASEHLRPKK